MRVFIAVEISNEKKLKIIKNDMRFESFEDWLREVIWYGHRSGKYMCKIENIFNTKNPGTDKEKGVLVGPYIA